MTMKKDTKRCKCGCGKPIIGHPNKKFVNTKHKDRYHNRVNPRGIALRRSGEYRWENENVGDPYSIEPEDIEDSMHPQDPYSLGQE